MTEEEVQTKAAAESAPGGEHTDHGNGMDTASGQGGEPGLNPRQQKLLAILVGDPDIHAASRAAGVSRSTAHCWLKQPMFREELARQRDSVLSEALGSVKTHAARAMAELAGLLCSKDDRLRRQVCNDILGHAMKVRELEDIETRLAALEKEMAQEEKRRNS